MITKISFNFLDHKSESNYYNCLKLGSNRKEFTIQDKVLKVDIDESEIPIFSSFYYVENIQLIHLSNEGRVETNIYNIPIYINEENSLSGFINETSKFSFEIIFNSTSKGKIPKFLKMNSFIVDKNDKFGLDNYVRYSIFNCQPDYINSIGYGIQFNPQYNSGSFLITVKEIENQYITKLFKIRKENYQNYCKKTLKDFNDSKINFVSSILNDYCSLDKNKTNFFHNNKDENVISPLAYLNEKLKLSKEEEYEIKFYFYTMQKFINNKFRNNRIEEYSQNHYLFAFNYCLWKFFSHVGKKKFKSEFNEFQDISSQIIKFNNLTWEEKINILFFIFEIEMNHQFIPKKQFRLNKEKYDDEYEKDKKKKFNYIPFFIPKIDNTLDFENYLEKIRQETTGEKYSLKRNFKKNEITEEGGIFFFSEINHKSAYYQAYDLLKKIIKNITKQSVLFELLYLVNSGTGINKISKETTFKMSLLSVEKIKKKLELLIPKFIYRDARILPQSISYNSYYSPISNILLINENIYFNFSLEVGYKELIEKDDNEGKYTIPLLMLFLHEFLGQGKYAFKENLKYGKEKSKNHMQKGFMEKPETFYVENKVDSGRFLEFFISPYEEIIYYLKYSQDSFRELLDYKLWISKDMSEINKIVAKKIILSGFDFMKERKLNKGKLLYSIPIPSDNSEDCIDSDQEYEDEINGWEDKCDRRLEDYFFRTERGVFCK